MFLVSETGYVKSFARLCDNVPRGNICIRDTKLLTCYESCTHDLCNNGNPDPTYLPTVNYASEIPTEKETRKDEYTGIQTQDHLGRSAFYPGQSPFRQRGSAFENFISRTNMWRTTNEQPTGDNPGVTGRQFTLFTSPTQSATFHGRGVNDARGLEDLYDLDIDNKVSIMEDNGEVGDYDDDDDDDGIQVTNASSDVKFPNNAQVMASVNADDVDLPDEEYYDDTEYDLDPESLAEVGEETQGVMIWPQGDINRLEEEELAREEEEVSVSNMIIEEDREEGLIEPYKANATRPNVRETSNKTKSEKRTDERLRLPNSSNIRLAVSSVVTNESGVASSDKLVRVIDGNKTKTVSEITPAAKKTNVQAKENITTSTAKIAKYVTLATPTMASTLKQNVLTAKPKTVKSDQKKKISGKHTSSEKPKDDQATLKITTSGGNQVAATTFKPKPTKRASSHEKTTRKSKQQTATTKWTTLSTKYTSSTKSKRNTHPVLMSTVKHAHTSSSPYPAKPTTLPVKSRLQKYDMSKVTMLKLTAFVTENPWASPESVTGKKNKETAGRKTEAKKSPDSINEKKNNAKKSPDSINEKKNNAKKSPDSVNEKETKAKNSPDSVNEKKNGQNAKKKTEQKTREKSEEKPEVMDDARNKTPLMSDYSSLPSEHAENLVWTSIPMKYYPTTKTKITKITPPIYKVTEAPTTVGTITSQTSLSVTSFRTIKAENVTEKSANSTKTDDVDNEIQQSPFTDLQSDGNATKRRQVYFDESATLGFSENEAGFLADTKADSFGSGASIVSSYVSVLLISLWVHVLQ